MPVETEPETDEEGGYCAVCGEWAAELDGGLCVDCKNATDAGKEIVNA